MLVTQQLDATSARDLTDATKKILGAAWENVEILYLGRAWVPLGYASWDEYCAQEFTDRLQLPREDRQEMVRSLREAGLSTHAIGSVVGVNQSTVVRDLARSTAGDAIASPANPLPTQPTSTPKIIGQDGKTYSLQAQPTPAYKPPTWVNALNTGDIKVVSLRDKELCVYLDSVGLLERIDRRSDWGNPFILPEDGTRQEVIAAYHLYYLPHKPSLLSRLDSLRGKALACWCAPEACHGDGIRNCALGRRWNA